jgi:hypothetical protein
MERVVAGRAGEVAWPSRSSNVSQLDVSSSVMCKVYHIVRTNKTTSL